MSEVSHMICEGALLLHFVHSLLWPCTNTMGSYLFKDALKIILKPSQNKKGQKKFLPTPFFESFGS